MGTRYTTAVRRTRPGCIVRAEAGAEQSSSVAGRVGVTRTSRTYHAVTRICSRGPVGTHRSYTYILAKNQKLARDDGL